MIHKCKPVCQPFASYSPVCHLVSYNKGLSSEHVGKTGIVFSLTTATVGSEALHPIRTNISQVFGVHSCYFVRVCVCVPAEI